MDGFLLISTSSISIDFFEGGLLHNIQGQHKADQ